MSVYSRHLKRPLDLVLSATALLILSPLLAGVACAVWLEDRGPAIFRQNRMGLSGRPFELLKFRSMPVGSAHVASSDATDLRVTRVGRAIRRLNVDELPQLLNVLRGDMSLVGPRPALPTQTRLLALRQTSAAWSLVPGMTGLAQVNAHDGMTAERKASWDAQYAERITLAGDVWIVLRTLAYLASRPPVY